MTLGYVCKFDDTIIPVATSTLIDRYITVAITSHYQTLHLSPVVKRLGYCCILGYTGLSLVELTSPPPLSPVTSLTPLYPPHFTPIDGVTATTITMIPQLLIPQPNRRMHTHTNPNMITYRDSYIKQGEN